MKPDLKVVIHPANNLMDVPLQLRRLADQFEKGEPSATRCILITEEEGNPEPGVYEMGAVGGRLSLIGMLFLAAHTMSAMGPSSRHNEPNDTPA